MQDISRLDESGDTRPRILMMGPRRSGKSSIQRVVFQKMPPHETLFLEGSSGLDIKYVANNHLTQFQIWDFPGDFDFEGIICLNLDTCCSHLAHIDPHCMRYGEHILTDESIFKNAGVVLFVVDAQVCGL